MGQLSELKWLNRFLSETPGDSEIGGRSRQVPNACWSRVLPTPSPNPKLCLWSQEVGDDLGLDRGDGEILGGGEPVEGMDPMRNVTAATNLAIGQDNLETGEQLP